MHEEQIIFQPMGRRISVDENLTLLELANRAGAGIEAACGGMGRCGKCRVQVGETATPPGESEREILGADEARGYRLACQTQVREAASVWVPETSRLNSQVILTAGGDYTADFGPGIKSVELEVPLPGFEELAADRERMLMQLSQSAGIFEGRNHRQTPLSVLRGLEGKLRTEAGKVTVVTTRSGRILDVSPGWGHHCLGLAVDLGTTTVVAYLVDFRTGKPIGVKADMNPQVAEAEDVVSRISLCRERPENLERLSVMVRRCIERLASSVCREHGMETDRIFEIVVVGNTAMHHIFLGLNPVHLAMAPYTPVAAEGLTVWAAELGLVFSPETRVHIPPVKAGFVGADAVAMALALNADQVTEPTLMVDLGTNGEIVLAAPDRILCCSTAAGPAFEGGHIRWGMRAAPGAVDSVDLSNSDGTPILSVIDDLAPKGICGSGLVSLVSGLVHNGTVTSAGGFDLESSDIRLRMGPDGVEYLLAEAQETGTGRELVFTHHDLAQLQLAKAAIHAGVSLMMAEMGITRLSKVLLAGAFGNYLNVEAACGINMLPGVIPSQIESVGNAAGAGAVMVLMNCSHRFRAQNLANRMEYLELAFHPDFEDAFLDGMAFSA